MHYSRYPLWLLVTILVGYAYPLYYSTQVVHEVRPDTSFINSKLGKGFLLTLDNLVDNAVRYVTR